MSLGIEALFTSALGLQPPWVVEDVKLDTAKRCIDFEIGRRAAALAFPACGVAAQPVHDRLRRSWRHLDFFQFEAWLHCDVLRVACDACGKTMQIVVPKARPGSGFTAAFEVLALTLYRDLPVRQAITLLRCADKQLWRRIESYVAQARALESLAVAQIVGIDKASLRHGQGYITVMHDLDAKRLLLATHGPSHQTVLDFAADLKTHGVDPALVRHVCMDMSAAYAKGAALVLLAAQVSYDRFHVVAMANEAMDQVRRQEMAGDGAAVRATLGSANRKTLKQLMGGMRRNPGGWSRHQVDAMHWPQHSALKSARTWRLKMALREVYAQARAHNSAERAAADLKSWLSWARRYRLCPLNKLAITLKNCFDAVVREMLGAMNGLLQQAKRVARGFHTSVNFIAIAYLRMSRLKHLPTSPFATATAR